MPMWGYAIGGLATIAAGFFAAAALMPGETRQSPMAPVTSAFLAGERGPSTTVFGLLSTPVVDNDYLNSCLRFLPSAPEGWVRVTTWDARYPQVRDVLEQVWADQGKSLSAATGRGVLDDFLDRYSGPDAKSTNILAQDTLSSAIYLDVANDGFVQIVMKSRAWRESRQCRDEFLYQWTRFDPAKPPRYPLLNQFSYANMEKSSWGVPSELASKGYRNLRNHVSVSAGLEILVTGVHIDYVAWNLLNDDAMPEKIAQALPDS